MTEITLLDGSIGQELVERAGDKPTPLWSTTVMIDKPHLVSDVHDLYFDAGARVASTNTYPVLYDRLSAANLQEQRFQLWASAVEAAKDARDKCGSGRVAGAIGPLIASYRPDICPPAAEAEELYAEIVSALQEDACDLLLIETMSSIDQADGALRAAKKSHLPVWVSFSVDDFDGSKLRSGEALLTSYPFLKPMRPMRFLINCSRPKRLAMASRLCPRWAFPLEPMPTGLHISDGFLETRPTVDALSARQDLSPDEYARFAMEWIAQEPQLSEGAVRLTHQRAGRAD